MVADTLVEFTQHLGVEVFSEHADEILTLIRPQKLEKFSQVGSAQRQDQLARRRSIRTVDGIDHGAYKSGRQRLFRRLVPGFCKSRIGQERHSR